MSLLPGSALSRRPLQASDRARVCDELARTGWARRGCPSFDVWPTQQSCVSRGDLTPSLSSDAPCRGVGAFDCGRAGGLFEGIGRAAGTFLSSVRSSALVPLGERRPGPAGVAQV